MEKLVRQEGRERPEEKGLFWVRLQDRDRARQREESGGRGGQKAASKGRGSQEGRVGSQGSSTGDCIYPDVASAALFF